MINLLYLTFIDAKHRSMVTELALAPRIVQVLAIIRLVNDSISPRWHTHLFTSVIDLRVLIILEGWLEIQRPFNEPLRQLVPSFLLEQLIKLLHLLDLVCIRQTHSFTILQVNSPILVTNQELVVLLWTDLMVHEMLLCLVIALLQVVEPFTYFFLA